LSNRTRIETSGPVPAPVARGEHAGGPSLQPEKRLMVAVLKDALFVLRRCQAAEGPSAQRQVRDTEAWFASHDRSWPFAFERICEELGLDPDHVRAGVRRWCRPQARPALRARDCAAYFRAYLQGGHLLRH
jgi:hypothetical protein